jgi:hypothetical protein
MTGTKAFAEIQEQWGKSVDELQKVSTQAVEAGFGLAGKGLEAQKAYALTVTGIVADAVRRGNGAAKS